jgi:hypothetical protein
VRAFTEEPVQEADIRAIVRAGMHAPSAHNRRAWQMLTVTDRATLDALAPMNRWWGMLKEATLCVVTLSYSPGIRPEDEEFLVQDGAAATENMLLAIHALGLGGVWLGVHPQRPYYKDVKIAPQRPRRHAGSKPHRRRAPAPAAAPARSARRSVLKRRSGTKSVTYSAYTRENSYGNEQCKMYNEQWIRGPSDCGRRLGRLPCGASPSGFSQYKSVSSFMFKEIPQGFPQALSFFIVNCSLFWEQHDEPAERAAPVHHFL